MSVFMKHLLYTEEYNTVKISSPQTSKANEEKSLQKLKYVVRALLESILLKIKEKIMTTESMCFD